MRLFWALVPPRGVVEALRPSLERLAEAHPELRWTAPETWHVTLAFLGDVEGDLVDSLVQAVARATAGQAPVQVALSRSASTPGGRRGVVWLAVESTPALNGLATDVRTATARVTPVDTTHAWRGHLTLARTRRRATDPGALARAVASEHVGPPVEWTADSLALVHSTTPGAGAQYRTLESVPLSGPRERTG